MLIQTWSKLCLIIFFCILLILWRPFFMVIKASWMGETFGNFRFQFFWKITPLLQLLLLRGENPIEKLAASSSNIVISQTALFITFQVCNFRGSREMIKFLFIQVQDIISKLYTCVMKNWSRWYVMQNYISCCLLSQKHRKKTALTSQFLTHGLM